jgi:hypothetical protein
MAQSAASSNDGKHGIPGNESNQAGPPKDLTQESCAFELPALGITRAHTGGNEPRQKAGGDSGRVENLSGFVWRIAVFNAWETNEKPRARADTMRQHYSCPSLDEFTELEF